MTRTERVLAGHWRWIATVCALVALCGLGVILWQRMDAEISRGDRLAAEADLRGEAVSTLAGDVRQLRSQLQAEGETPVVPDPGTAIEDLPDRAEVPVPIPGPRGPRGEPGRPAPTITPSPGEPGSPGADSTIPGPAGVDGQPGADSTVPGPRGEKGDTGDRGPAGPAPSGWTYTDPQGVTYECTPDTDASTHYTCRATSAPEPTDTPQRGLSLAVLAATASYRRL